MTTLEIVGRVITASAPVAVIYVLWKSIRARRVRTSLRDYLTRDKEPVGYWIGIIRIALLAASLTAFAFAAFFMGRFF